ncbi:MAG: outer membrane protein assembly factor BamA [Porticoccaceae bacterium]|nr:outer membrane protein assembly factor BamA [Porticoccaceae bacterium]MBT5577672.1 outer membrane protein assembly factor BamA [Porticoccaceae bacterium]
MKRLLSGLFLVLFSLSFTVRAAVFQVEDIRIEGLQRVSAGTVFASLPVGVGDLVDETGIQDATRSLFRTGYFADVVMARENGILVIGLVERPAVTEINLEGNKAIETDQLLDALRDNGLAEGQIFRQVILEGMTQELQRQYVSQGRYGALVKTEVKQLPRNRVAVNIDIDEGDVAKIRHINIVGNKDFSEEELLDTFEQNTTGWLSWISSDDKYAREKLSGDLESLETFYLDRGYLKFEVESTQVSISPDKESVYITINIDEGDVYKISGIELSGELKISEPQARALILMREGMIFSQALMTTSSEYITRRLGNEGYTFAEVQGYPEVDEEDKTATVTFVVTPGMRAYVRRVEFRGNTKTADEVLRREMRQMEGASANNALIELSKVRLERLGYFKEVSVENLPVAGSNDQIDVVYSVEEQPSGSVGASVGYAQGNGLILGGNLNENNFLGTGKQVGVGINRSTYQSSLNFSYTEPYFTVDGVGVGYSVYARETDYDRINVASFSTNTYGATVNWSYPISEIQRIGLGLGYENLDLKTGLYASREIADFVDANGDNFDVFSLNVNWMKSTLNRGIFATRGSSQRLNLDLTVPGSGLEYYKFVYSAEHLRGLTNTLTLKLRADLGYGESYGETTQLPFFKNFYGGGFGSVRGFKRNTLGPQDTPCNFRDPPCNTSFIDDPDPIGGNVKVELGAEVIFPLPFLKDQRSVQSSLFFDAGNIFNTKCGESQISCYKPDVGEMRYSVGLGATWLSGFGPITFSLAKPLNANEFDETEVFQFSLGNQF